MTPRPPSSSPGPRSRFRVGFRTVQLAMILGVLLTTFLAIGIAAFSYARRAVGGLSDQVLVQAAERIDLRVREVADMAVAHGTITERLIESGRAPVDDPTTMLRLFLPVLRAESRLTYLSFGTERGEYWHVVRSGTGVLGIQELRLYPSGNRWQRDWELVDGERKLVHEVADPPFDPRVRPYYTAARAAGGPVWTESYVFADLLADRDVTGVTRAVPIYRIGALVGVLTIDLDLLSLSDYLRVVPVGRTGFAFLLEERQDGRRVIAHPNEDFMSRKSASDATVVEAIPAEESPDPIVRAFTALVPQDLDATGPLVPVRLTVDGKDYFGAYKRVGGADPPPWVLCAVLPVSDVMGRVDQMTRTLAFVASLGVLVALLLGLRVARLLSETLGELEKEMHGIAQFDLSPRLLSEHPSRIRELDDMRAATDQMKRGLRSFGRYVPTELVRQLMRLGGEARLGAERVEITVLLVDIAGFTTLVESKPPEVVLEALGEYLTEMNQAILATDGTVCQYLGDAVQAFWGAPVRQRTHALRACRAALDMRERTRRLAAKAIEHGLTPLNTRFGLCTGTALVGNIGAPDRFNYGCVGGPVSTASWLEGLNKVYGTNMLIADTTAILVGKQLVTRPIDRVMMPGQPEPVLVHELVGTPETVSDAAKAGLEDYRTGLDAIHRGRFEAARIAFARAQEALGGDDGPCRVMLDFLDTRTRPR